MRKSAGKVSWSEEKERDETSDRKLTTPSETKTHLSPGSLTRERKRRKGKEEGRSAFDCPSESSARREERVPLTFRSNAFASTILVIFLGSYETSEEARESAANQGRMSSREEKGKGGRTER